MTSSIRSRLDRIARSFPGPPRPDLAAWGRFRQDLRRIYGGPDEPQDDEPLTEDDYWQDLDAFRLAVKEVYGEQS